MANREATTEDILAFMDEDERAYLDSGKGTEEERANFWEDLKNLWNSIPNPTEDDLKPPYMHHVDWQSYLFGTPSGREGVFSFHKRKWKKERKVAARQAQEDKPKGVRVPGSSREPTARERRLAELRKFMPKQLREEYDRANAKRREAIWETNERLYDAAQKREEDKIRREQEHTEKVLDLLQTFREDPGKVHLLPPDDSSLADLDKWYEEMSRPVGRPFGSANSGEGVGSAPLFLETPTRKQTTTTDDDKPMVGARADPKAVSDMSRGAIAASRDGSTFPDNPPRRTPSEEVYDEVRELFSDCPNELPVAPKATAKKSDEHWFETGIGDARLWGIAAVIAFAIAFSRRSANSDLAVWLFLCVAAILLVLIVNTHRAIRSGQRRTFWTFNTLIVMIPLTWAAGTWLTFVTPRGFLQIDKIEILQQYSVIATGRQWGGNVSSVNPGPERVLNAFAFSQAFVEEVDDYTNQKVRVLFDKRLNSERLRYLAGDITGPEAGVGRGLWTTVLTEPLTDHQANGILNGTSRVYFVTWFAWTDSDGHKGWAYDCRWLQSFREFPYKKEDIVWHFCAE